MLVALLVNLAQWVHALAADLPLPGLTWVGWVTIALAVAALGCAVRGDRVHAGHACFDTEVVLGGWLRRRASGRVVEPPTS
jgi:hypothetical protein